jgi:hypothetical protein
MPRMGTNGTPGVRNGRATSTSQPLQYAFFSGQIVRCHAERQCGCYLTDWIARPTLNMGQQ